MGDKQTYTVLWSPKIYAAEVARLTAMLVTSGKVSRWLAKELEKARADIAERDGELEAAREVIKEITESREDALRRRTNDMKARARAFADRDAAR